MLSNLTSPTIDQFLSEIAIILRERNGLKLQDYLVLEPPLPPLYSAIVTELRQSFPPARHDNLEEKCKKLLSEDEGDTARDSWTAFISFMLQYFAFLRDVNVEHLVETHDALKSLLNQCILALSDVSMGIVVLPTVVALSRTLARLAIGLDQRPDLIAHLSRRESSAGGDDGAERVTLVESSANVIREAFKKCLSERSGNSSGLTPAGRPEGRRVGIYLCANICLKLFFHCRKLRSAEQIFGNIYQQSPPLARFPASQRVSFLYYLGRYHFANNHFFRAQLALQAAYDQCHARCLKQRRSIIVYLITTNIILGRFPSTQLLQRPEACSLGEKFLPICQAVRKGDIATFENLLDIENENASWFLRRRVLLQLRNRCEVLIWRSLARKTFLISGFRGDTTRRAPSLSLDDLLILANYLKQRSVDRQHLRNGISANYETNGYVDPDLADEVESTGPDLPTMEEIESIAASLINQGLFHGYLSHKHARFAITGAKNNLAVEIGFPNVWETIRSKADDEVPGWVRENGAGLMRSAGKAGPGMVVNLSGARPAGAAAA